MSRIHNTAGSRLRTDAWQTLLFHLFLSNLVNLFSEAVLIDWNTVAIITSLVQTFSSEGKDVTPAVSDAGSDLEPG
jgi:hypothetical protein